MKNSQTNPKKDSLANDESTSAKTYRLAREEHELEITRSFLKARELSLMSRLREAQELIADTQQLLKDLKNPTTHDRDSNSNELSSKSPSPSNS